MRWADDEWVKVSTYDTADWLLLSYEARSLFLQILRKVDRAGQIDLGRLGRKGVAVVLRATESWDRIEPALLELEQDGCLGVADGMLTVRGFPESAFPGRRLQTLAEIDGLRLKLREDSDVDVKVRILTPEERAQKQAEAEANAAKWRAEQEERRSRIKGKPHVYFIQQGDSGAIKIGCSKNPAQRLQGLQTGHSEPLRLLTCAVGSQAQERALHDRFAHLRVSGEWFRPAEDLLAYIRLVNDRRAL